MRVTDAIVARLQAAVSEGLLGGGLTRDDIIPLNPDLGASTPPKVGVVAEHPIPEGNSQILESSVQVAIYAKDLGTIDDISDQVVRAMNAAPFESRDGRVYSTQLTGSATALIDPGPALARTLQFTAQVEEI